MNFICISKDKADILRKVLLSTKSLQKGLKAQQFEDLVCFPLAKNLDSDIIAENNLQDVVYKSLEAKPKGGIRHYQDLLKDSLKEDEFSRLPKSYDIIGSYDQSYNHGLFNYRGAGGELLENLMCSYGMNLFACSTPVDVQGRKKAYHYQNQNQLRHAGEIPIFLDAMWRGGGPHWDGTEDISPPQENGHWVGYGHEMKHFAMDRHGGGVNALFVDGGARKVQVKELWDLRWHVGYPINRAREQPASWWGPWLSKE